MYLSKEQHLKTYLHIYSCRQFLTQLLKERNLYGYLPYKIKNQFIE